jgi:hypothetical protein
VKLPKQASHKMGSRETTELSGCVAGHQLNIWRYLEEIIWVMGEISTSYCHQMFMRSSEEPFKVN